MIRVLLVDDQLLFRECIGRVINTWEDFDVIGQAKNGKEGVEMCAELDPDIVLMDIDMPVMNGIEATKLIHAADPDMRIVILTVSSEDRGLFEALRNGAQGYLLKDMPTDELQVKLMKAMRDEAPLSGSIATRIVQELNRSEQPARSQASNEDRRVERTLTAREREVLSCLARGLSNRDIANELFISEKTVKKHLNSIFAKLDCESRSQAALFAVRVGVIPESGM